MRRFRIIVETDISGSKCETVVELPDDASDADIEKEAREAAMDMISWYWEEIE